MIKSFSLFFVTAFFEILGCYAVLQWMNTTNKGSMGLGHLVSAIASLGLFAWLLTLHPTDSGRVYATYGGVYVLASLLWLWLMDGLVPTRLDLIGGLMVIGGSAVIASQYLIKS